MRADSRSQAAEARNILMNTPAVGSGALHTDRTQGSPHKAHTGPCSSHHTVDAHMDRIHRQVERPHKDLARKLCDHWNHLPKAQGRALSASSPAQSFWSMLRAKGGPTPELLEVYVSAWLRRLGRG